MLVPLLNFMLKYWQKVSGNPSSSANCPNAAMEEGNLDSLNYPYKKDPPSNFFPADLEGVARFLDTDSDLWVFRRFGKLHLVNLLRLQLDLVRLEHELDMQIAGGEEEGSKTLLSDIRRSLSEYDTALSAHLKFKSYKEPNDSIIAQLTEWATTPRVENSQPLLQGLGIRCPGTPCLKDLASIAAVEKTWTHQFIDNHHFLRRIFVIPIDKMPPEQRPSSKTRTTLLYSEANVRLAEAAFLHMSFCILLIIPVIILSYMESKILKLALLAISLFAASVLCIGFLNSPNRACLSLVAGYAAILVVFLSGNVGS